ncbi:hypothetical protein AVEN_167982-1 [Araneus ventricosus]|uniref:Uncharacterized protein n=1 Tax=Araneus ventricosus TaxID=182803 RepID=A0A4Y2PVJ9_ARAVE|nr:hypothetical protein AVEN_167982-1 [Araneus ventricosus]
MTLHSKWKNENEYPNVLTTPSQFSSDFCIDNGFWSDTTQIVWSDLTVNVPLLTDGYNTGFEYRKVAVEEYKQRQSAYKRLRNKSSSESAVSELTAIRRNKISEDVTSHARSILAAILFVTKFPAA